MQQLKKELKKAGIIINENNCIEYNIADDKTGIGERLNVDNYRKVLEKYQEINGGDADIDKTIASILKEFNESELIEIKNAWRYSYDPFTIEVLKASADNHFVLYNKISSYWEIYSPFHKENDNNAFKQQVLNKIDQLDAFEQECFNYHMYDISVD